MLRTITQVALRTSSRQQFVSTVHTFPFPSPVMIPPASVVAGRRYCSAPEEEERFADEFDVVIVGGGPSGLSAAIRLKQLAGWLRLHWCACVHVCVFSIFHCSSVCTHISDGLCSSATGVLLVFLFVAANDQDFRVCVVEKGAEVGR
jgi:hypothetical protein